VCCAGCDLTAALLRNHLSGGENITVVGLSARWLPTLIERTGITALAYYGPPAGFDREPDTMGAPVEFVLDFPARFVFLAVGSPRQEMLAAAIRATGRANGVGLCIGTSLEFISGGRPRAPVDAARRTEMAASIVAAAAAKGVALSGRLPCDLSIAAARTIRGAARC